MHCAALALAIGLLPLTAGLGASATQSVVGTEAHLARAPHPALYPPVHQRRHLSLRGGGGARGGKSRMSMVGHPVATSAAVIGAANLLGLGITLSTRTNYHTDLLGTGSFVLAAWCTKGVDSLQLLSAGAIGVWAAKLASFLFIRVLRRPDTRLDSATSTLAGASAFWFASFLWGFVVSLPHSLAAAVATRPEPGPVHLLALGLYLVGLSIETVADAQKQIFKADPANKGHFCRSGLWALSQHPNWCGNLILWCGILLLNTPTLLTTQPGESLLAPALRLAAAALSPALLLALFNGQASGAVGDGVALAEKAYGKKPGYGAYLATTPLIFPKGEKLVQAIGNLLGF